MPNIIPGIEWTFNKLWLVAITILTPEKEKSSLILGRFLESSYE